jgi:glycosyltransferase involved in cell wall biosynthesis
VDAVLALVGSGSLEGQIKEQIASLGLGVVVRFALPRPQIAEAYTDADVVALSSRWEGLPYTVVEAMAYGKPVVATCVDGIPEAVEDGVMGLLVEPGDASALALALSELLGDTCRSARMGQEGVKRVAERFSIDGMLDALAHVYEEVAGG